MYVSISCWCSQTVRIFTREITCCNAGKVKIVIVHTVSCMPATLDVILRKEKNFHVFYYLLAGLTYRNALNKYQLRPMQQHRSVLLLLLLYTTRTDRQTYRQTHTHVWEHRHTHIHKHTDTNKHTDIHTFMNTQTDRHKNTHITHIWLM